MFGLRNKAQGILDDIREKGGLDARSLRERVAKGDVTILVEPRLNPWPVPRLFSLSRNQALELLDAVERENVRVDYVVRSDGTVALHRRDDADTGIDGLLAGGTRPLP
jgi:hypothetical protein